MQINGNGVVVVELDVNTLGIGLLAEQMVQTILHGAGCHALNTKAIGSGGAGNVGVHTGADDDAAIFVFVTDHSKTSKNSECKMQSAELV